MVSTLKVNLKKSRILLIPLLTMVFMMVGAFLNYWLGCAVRQAAKNQFNEEQLVVARGIKHWIEGQIGFIAKELTLAAEDIEGTGLKQSDLDTILHPSIERLLEIGLSSIEISDKDKGLTFVYYPYRKKVATIFNEISDQKKEITKTKPHHTISVSQPQQKGRGMYLKLSVPIDHREYDRLSFELNLAWFLTPFLKTVRSGKTGYAWIIDSQGRFLFHPQTEFVGQNAFEARRVRDPDFSYRQIHTIQQEKMLKGMEGTGSYHSTWHRGITGDIEKLIAYCPVSVCSASGQFWSVAVAAPVFEIEDTVSTIHLWQAVLQGLVFLVIFAGGGALLWFEIRWSRSLEKLVSDRTKALKHSEENYRSLVESAEDFIFTLDEKGRLTSVNNYTAAFFGSPPGELIGAGLNDLFCREVAEKQSKIVRTVFEKGKSIRDEFERGTDDAEIWISANFMPLRDNAGRISAVLCIARDITENKKLERHLINTEKLASLGTLAAGVAHEINNPLAVMLGFCDLLVRKKEPGSQEFDDLKIIERQGLHCKEIVENLLSFARVGRDSTTETDLNDCLQEIIKVVDYSLKKSAIELHIDLADNLPPVKGDDRQLQQVFLNLINNAAAAMPEGGLLTIKTFLSSGGKKVTAWLRDQGAGIPSEIIDHIFEPFFTTKPEGEGTGLGLFVSYGIINKFGGSITCESQTHETAGKSRGTAFTVELIRSG